MVARERWRLLYLAIARLSAGTAIFLPRRCPVPNLALHSQLHHPVRSPKVFHLTSDAPLATFQVRAVQLTHLQLAPKQCGFWRR